ncbi:MAG: PKD domain-containing protein [Bacteroidota bacterium]
MKACLSLLGFIVFALTAAATQYTATGNGNWSSSSTWSPSGVPGANDTVSIAGGYAVTVTANASCKRLTLTNTAGTLSANNTTLTVNSGVSLTVNGQLSQNVTVSALVIGACYLNVYGTLNITGNYTQNHTLALLGNSNQMQIGDGSNSGTVNISGNFVQQNGFLTALGNANKVLLANGVLDVDGNINFQAGAINLLSTNEINVNDNSSFDGKSKSIYFAGNFTGTNQGTVTRSDANNNTNYTFYYNGTTAQDLATQNIYYKHVTINNPGAEVNLINTIGNINFAGTITVASGGVLNTKTYNMDSINSYAGQINIVAGGTLKVENAAGVPQQKVGGAFVCAPASLGTVEFYSTSALTVFDEDFEFTTVKLTGPGTKTYSTSASRQIDNSGIKIQQIQLLEGTFVIPDGKKLQLSSSGAKLLSLAAGTTLAIQGDLTALDANVSLDYNSTVWYQKNGDQSVYSFTNNGAIEAYGNLKMARQSGTGTANRNITANTNVRVAGKVSLEDYAKLVIKANASLELMSTASKTAYIAPVAATSSISYEGIPVGKVIAHKLISLPDANYRDFSSPIIGATLNSWKKAGLEFTGFTGSQYPSSQWVNAFYYDEGYTGSLEDGWIPADAISNEIMHDNGSGQFSNGAWRIYSGLTGGLGVALADSGEVRYGDVPFECTFSHASQNRSWDDGWNMLGNPYPAPLNWNKIYRDASNSASFGANGIQSTYYVWKPADNGVPSDEEDSYGFYNAATGVGSGLDSIIPSFQGFWVKTYEASANSGVYPLTVKESHKENSGDSKFYKGGQEGGVQGLVTVLLKSGEYEDKIWFHPWPEATVGADEVFDVNRFGTNSPFSSINFSQNGEPLFLWVNALPYKAYTMEVPLYIKSIAGESLTITFRDILSFNDAFGCIKLLDKLNGNITDLATDSSYTFFAEEGYSGERFVLLMSRTIENKIVTANGRCASAEDGMLDVDLSTYPDDVDMVLYKEGAAYKTYTGNVDQINEQLGAGNYELRNNKGEISCSMSSFNFIITTGNPIIAKFSAPQQTNTQTEISFENSSEGAVQWNWDFGDGSEASAEFSPKHTYTLAGTYTATLTAYNADGCESVSSREIAVENTTGIASVKQSDKIRVHAAENGIAVNTTLTSGTIRIFTTDGRLVAQQAITSGKQVIPVTASMSVWIVSVNSEEENYQTKIMY